MLLLAALSLLADDASVGYDRPADVEVTPLVGFGTGGEFDDEDTGNELDLNDASLYGIAVNFWARNNTEWEIYYAHQETELDTSGTQVSEPELDIGTDYLHAGGTYLFDGEVARPYIVATLGASRFDPAPSGVDSETFFSFSVGGGLKFFPKKRIGLRLESRVFGHVLDSDSEIFCETGPDLNACAVQVDSKVLWQWQATAGVIFRFQ